MTMMINTGDSSKHCPVCGPRCPCCGGKMVATPQPQPTFVPWVAPAEPYYPTYPWPGTGITWTTDHVVYGAYNGAADGCAGDPFIGQIQVLS
jgi:hypothetical protein